MAYSIEQLNAFICIVEQGSIRQAAVHMGKHISTIREQLNNLEIDSGLNLFVRQPKSIQITEHGQDLYRYAKSICLEMNHLENKVDSLLRGEPSKLTIAIDNSLVDMQVSKLICEVQKKFPSLQLRIITGDTLQTRSSLLNQNADVGLLLGTHQRLQDLIYVQAFSFYVMRVAPMDWDIDSIRTEQQLRQQVQVAYSYFSELGQADADIMSNKVVSCNNGKQILDLVKSGLGFAHLPDFVCQQAVADSEVQLCNLNNEKEAIWYADVCWHADKPLNSTMQYFVEQVKNITMRHHISS